MSTMSVRAEATRLQGQGYCVMGLDLTYDTELQKKSMHFKTGWQQASLKSCLTNMFNADDNALAIITGLVRVYQKVDRLGRL